MRDRCRVTVIMGVYNCESTLSAAVDSLLSQTFKDFKLIMCDDGSTDSSLEIAQRYESEHDNIKVIRNKHNVGLNATLNRCLDLADTEYVARMDADDISLPYRFETQIAFLDKHPEYALVSSSMICFDQNGDFGTILLKEGSPHPTDFIRHSPFFHAPAMVRLSAYRSVGGYSVEQRLLRVEDYHLWFKMYEKGLRGYNLSRALYKVREDRNAEQRRNLRNRLNEMYVKYLGYRMLDLPKRYYIFIAEPLIKHFIPTLLYRKLHRRNITK